MSLHSLLQLNFEPKQTVFTNVHSAQAQVSIAISPLLIEQRFIDVVLPQPNKIEEAIMVIEDAIMLRAKQKLDVPSVQIQQTQIVTLMPFLAIELLPNLTETNEPTQLITRDAIESYFNRYVGILMGSPAKDHELPTSPNAVAILILLRELTHHLNIGALEVI